jgi:beta-ribofuranosylaminobenzene 5'-phosphate synthase
MKTETQPVLERITISAPSRLHFGLFSVGDAVARKFGGVGLMIDSPRTVVTASASDRLEITGPGQAASERALENWFTTMRLALKETLAITELSCLPVKLEIEALPPRHAGFGTGTQLALASAWAVTRFLGLATPSPVELATAVGRGKRSGIGSHGFGRGGFLVDRGKLDGESLAPLDFQTDFPEPWSIVTVIHKDSNGLSGDLESNAFSNLPDTTEAQRNEMIEIVRE